MSTEGGSHFPPKHIIWQLHRWHRRGRRWATEVNIKCVEDLQPQYSEHAPEAPTGKPRWFLIGERSALGGDAVHTDRASLVLPEMILGCRGLSTTSGPNDTSSVITTARTHAPPMGVTMSLYAAVSHCMPLRVEAYTCFHYM